MVSNLLSGNQEFLKEIRDDYQAVRDLHGQKKAKKYLSIEEARANKLKINWDNTPIYKPNFVGIKQLIDYPISELRKYIDWTFFFFVWELKGKFPDILNDELQGEEARKLYADANRMLDRMEAEKMVQTNGVFGIWPANADGDDIVVYEDETREKEAGRFYELRQQEAKKTELPELLSG